jgi:hypothetical protein
MLTESPGSAHALGRVQSNVPEEVAWQAREFGSQDKDLGLQRLPGSFFKVGEIPSGITGSHHLGSCGVPLERLHPPSVHASPSLQPYGLIRRFGGKEPDQGSEEGLAPPPDVVHELEEALVQRQLLLRDTPLMRSRTSHDATSSSTKCTR